MPTEMHNPAHFGQDLAGFVLAGGRSSRMGVDKALVELDGRPLIAHALGILRGAGLDVAIAGARAQLDGFARVVADLYPDLGPLGGICSALAATSARWSVFLPVDLPLLPPALISYQLKKAREKDAAVTVASVEGFAQTFPVVIDRATLPYLDQEVAAGRLGCLSALQNAAESLTRPLVVLSVEEAIASGQLVAPCGNAPDRWFLNLNAPEDLRRAEARPERI